jgi:hypothetical protein
MGYPRPNSHLYGGYTLDPEAVKVLQVFVERVWQSYLTGKPLSREFCYPTLKNDWRQNLYYRFYKDYLYGNVEYEFDIDGESLEKPTPRQLLTLKSKFSKEV